MLRHVDAAVTATLVGVGATALLTIIGYLVKQQLVDIKAELVHVNISLDDIPGRIYEISERVTRLETWRELHARRTGSDR